MVQTGRLLPVSASGSTFADPTCRARRTPSGRTGVPIEREHDDVEQFELFQGRGAGRE
ncbi:MAG TPA: hypothetical protein VK904_06485 [Miltoncostaeaceae bacterium]|nr:hypothetical protein [Miltoncostaeaceae bacterium]